MCCYISKVRTKEFLAKNAKKKFVWGWKELKASGVGNYYYHQYGPGEHRSGFNNTIYGYNGHGNYKKIHRGFHFWLQDRSKYGPYYIRVKVYLKDIFGTSDNLDETVANAITIEKKDWRNFKARMRRLNKNGYDYNYA